MSRLWATSLFEIVLALLMAVFSALVFLQVLIRYVIDLGIFGLNDVTALIVVWMYFLGAGYAARSGEHISASLVETLVPSGGQVQRAIAVVANVLTAAVMALFAYWAAQYAIWSHEKGAVTAELKLPRLHFALPIALGSAMMAWFFLVNAVREARFLAGRAR